MSNTSSYSPNARGTPQQSFFTKALNLLHQKNRVSQVLENTSETLSIINSLYLRTPNLYLSTSPIHQTGLFTSQLLSKGTFIPTTSTTLRLLENINDGAYFPLRNLIPSTQPFEILFPRVQTAYYAKSEKLANIKNVYPEGDNQGIPSGILVTRDVYPGEELLRTYGVGTWLLMLPWEDGWLSEGDLGKYLIEHFIEICEKDENGWERVCAMVAMRWPEALGEF